MSENIQLADHPLSLDYSTVHFCSSLLSVSYGTMFLILFAKRREKALLYWSLSLFLVAAAGYGFTLVESRLAIALLLGLVAFNVTLIWAGARAFDGKPPFEWTMAVMPVLAAVLHYGASTAGQPALASAFSTLLLAANVLVVGCYFLRRGDNRQRFGRKIVAGALFAYIPVYLVSSSLYALAFGSEVPAVAILVGDLVLNNVFVVGLFSVIEDRTRNALRVMAETDELTGALNRGGFLKRGARKLGKDAAAAVLLADLDHFKLINDTYGHAAGDRVLTVFAGQMREALGDDALIGRLGGEEFAVLLPGCDEASATALAERLRLAMAARRIAWDDTVITATVSIGVAGHRYGETFETTLRHADEALYRAKKTGRNRIAA
jgi:diguanylate cyclase (GGDEF)-like protein